jgi:hypothetical protein
VLVLVRSVVLVHVFIPWRGWLPVVSGIAAVSTV